MNDIQSFFYESMQLAWKWNKYNVNEDDSCLYIVVMRGIFF